MPLMIVGLTIVSRQQKLHLLLNAKNGNNTAFVSKLFDTVGKPACIGHDSIDLAGSLWADNRQKRQQINPLSLHVTGTRV